MEDIREYINETNLIKNEIYKAFKDSILCQICTGIMIEPMMCMNCQNVYCKECIEHWTILDKKCPNRCLNPNYKKSLAMGQLLSKLNFQCKKCNNTYMYDEMIKHYYSDCGLNNIQSEINNINNNREQSINISGIFERIEKKNKILKEPKTKITSNKIII